MMYFCKKILYVNIYLKYPKQIKLLLRKKIKILAMYNSQENTLFISGKVQYINNKQMYAGKKFVSESIERKENYVYPFWFNF